MSRIEWTPECRNAEASYEEKLETAKSEAVEMIQNGATKDDAVRAVVNNIFPTPDAGSSDVILQRWGHFRQRLEYDLRTEIDETAIRIEMYHNLILETIQNYRNICLPASISDSPPNEEDVPGSEKHYGQVIRRRINAILKNAPDSNDAGLAEELYNWGMEQI